MQNLFFMLVIFIHAAVGADNLCELYVREYAYNRFDEYVAYKCQPDGTAKPSGCSGQAAHKSEIGAHIKDCCAKNLPNPHPGIHVTGFPCESVPREEIYAMFNDAGSNPSVAERQITPSESPATAKGPASTELTEPVTETVAEEKTADEDGAPDRDSDVNQCLYGSNEVKRCCDNPYLCGTVKDANITVSENSSIKEKCEAAKKLGKNSSNVNNQLSAICSAQISVCTASCDSLIKKYQSRRDSATVVDLNTARGLCTAYNVRAQVLGSQGTDGATVSFAGNQCADSVTMEEQTASNGDPEGKDSDSKSLKVKSVALTDNASPPSAPPLSSTATAQMLDAPNGSAPNQDGPLENKIGSPTHTPSAGSSRKYGTIPNNTGGKIPGESGIGTAASAANARKAPSGYNTAVLLGFQDGDGYSQEAGREPAAEVVLKKPVPSQAETKDSNLKNPYLGMDLKRFLPGGTQLPSPEINGQGTNIFERIHIRFIEKCKLGLLLDCES